MTDILRCIRELKEYTPLRASVLSGSSCAVFGVDAQKAYFAALLADDTKKRFFIIVPDEKQARITRDFLESEIGGTYSFPAKDYTFRDIESASRFDENKRIETISHIRKSDFKSIVIPAEALCALTMHPDEYNDLVLYADTQTSFSDIQQTISDYGYENFPQVEGPGQFSVRGGIIDVFPPAEETPYRIEFFGDDIDSIYRFDINTQRRTEPVDMVHITPAVEHTAMLADKLKDELFSHISNDNVRKDISLLESGILPRHDRYLPAYYEKTACILDFVGKDDRIVIFDHGACMQSIEGYISRLREDIKSSVEDGYYFLKRPYYHTKESILSKIASPIIFDTFTCSIHEFPLSELLEIKMFPSAITNMETLTEDISRNIDEGYDVTVLTLNKTHTEDLRKELGSQTSLHIEQGSIPYGFILPAIKKAVYSYKQKNTDETRARRTKFQKGDRIHGFADIHQGDYIVHENYGIGVYDGIHKVESLGVINDYIKIRFAGTDVLYIPCAQLNQISKYTGGAEGASVKLNKLGGTEWEKTKQRVKKSVKDLAKQLIALYGQRLKLKGHAYSPDTEWQRDFEARFEFEETPDQLKSISEIKADMESSVPMDRLLCGDVGYGKTEVALRAVFKAVTDGKQAAILAPTTILAFQHYNTMLSRFAEYPIRVELLSRLRSPSQQSKITAKLRSGKIDVIVGTHRILQKDVVFKDLGLIVIDEEQRFGVGHKEHLKEISKTADVLTLSATPIPRTLNMSMSGIRDISILNDPPCNRYPVTTYVAEYDLGIIVDALKREVSRGGQCFYLHNRIESIYKTANTLYDKTGFRIQVAHGQMSQEELSSIWESLVKGEIDVLVCTTIIETGVDVPNCNTLIIEDADRLGLAQLHQIRGRVGRSDRRAFAYFMFKRGKTLSEDAYKRLMTIKEFTEFGSGLKIAMRDLEIRGAGNVLGAEQSGHMLTVGYDMYMKLLEEAVSEEQGLTTEEVSCTVDIKINAYIPDKYIRDTETRIEIYKLIASIKDNDTYSDVLDELIDRFGDPPKPVESLLSVAKMKASAGSMNITKIEQAQNGINLILSKEPDVNLISEIASMYRRKLFYTPGGHPYYTLKCDDILTDLEQFMVNYRKCIDSLKNK